MDSPITRQSTVSTLVDFWLQQLRAERRLDGTTISEYERVLVKLVVPGLGGVCLGELTTERINVVLVELGTKSLNRQRKAKVVMGEVLALRWADIDLGARVVEINATIKTESGIGTYRKPLRHPRLVTLPEFAALVLRARRRSIPDNFLDAVFPTRNVTWQQVNNVERRWRQIRSEAGLEWITPEVFRRSSSAAVPSRRAPREC